MPLSLSLPSTSSQHAGAAVTTWLWNLLPDSRTALSAIAQEYGADPRDPLSLLEAVGMDCAGAVQLCTPDQIEAVQQRQGSLESVSVTDLEARLAELDMDEDASWVLPGEHWSLGGAQQKFALRRHDGQWYRALGSEPTSHIVKPGLFRVRAQALAEYVSMKAAHRLELRAADVAYTEFGVQPALVVTRFDRLSTGDGSLARLHQEDMSMAAGTEVKYEEDGGPSIASVVKLLREHSSTRSQAEWNVAEFLDQVVFNVVVGSPDAHARNFSIQFTDGGLHVSPLYDVATDLGHERIGNHKRKVAMRVGGEDVRDAIGPTEWNRQAEQVGVDPDWLVGRVVWMAERLPDAIKEPFEGLDDWDGRISELRSRLLPNMRENCLRILSRF
jgi:serine/threonine-protein kinase HipA